MPFYRLLIISSRGSAGCFISVGNRSFCCGMERTVCGRAVPLTAGQNVIYRLAAADALSEETEVVVTDFFACIIYFLTVDGVIFHYCHYFSTFIHCNPIVV